MAGEREETPLKDEAARREEWRGKDKVTASGARGHMLPASEDEDERLGGSDEDSVGHPGTIPPPD